MSEDVNRTLALEAKTEHFLKLIPAAVRKAIIECVADLADEVAPDVRPSVSCYIDTELDREAFDAAIDQFTDHLKKTLLLDPEPWLSRLGLRYATGRELPIDKFQPRTFYTQNPEDYS